MFRLFFLIGLLGVWLLSGSFNISEESEEISALLQVPQGFPEVEFPKDNSFSEARWLLGRKLFFDPIMSKDSTISCSSCHMPQNAFSDTVALSIGAEKALGTRNAPTLANVAYHPYYTRDGGVATLEMQVLVPIQEHNEFNFNILLIGERMRSNAEYVRMSSKAYNKLPDYYVITRALGCYERTIISGNSGFDQQFIQGKIGLFSESELRGYELFFSEKAKCSSCHSGFNFTDYSFKNNGLYVEYEDYGRFRLTGDTTDRALFKVPSLRNVGLTAPYMHNGSIATLNGVVEHYSNGGEPHVNKSPLIRKLNLTETEKSDLVAFLHTLTDQEFINKTIYTP